jgi:hypothetical protein
LGCHAAFALHPRCTALALTAGMALWNNAPRCPYSNEKCGRSIPCFIGPWWQQAVLPGQTMQ